jgi:hypothetical protein
MLAGGSATAQSYQGGIRGSIIDADGVVPGVDVTLTNEHTNVARATVTNERGEYGFRLSSLERIGSGRGSRGKAADRPGVRIGTQGSS